MNTLRIRRLVGLFSCLLAMSGASPVWAQTFSSGSTGADGAFNPTCAPTPCTVPAALPASGIFNYTTVTIPSGVTVAYTLNAANTPVTILATGNVTVSGTISVNGSNGANGVNAGPLFSPGGAGGPGAFPGGAGSSRDGKPASDGHGPGGGISGGSLIGVNGTYGAPSSFVSLIPLFGGSGGSGAHRGDAFSGGGGGGGGGAIVVASSTQVTVTGAIRANGGQGGTISGSFSGGAGSGGAIRLVAPTVAGTGTLEARVGPSPIGTPPDGRIRLEAFTLSFTGSAAPAASFANAPGPVTAASTPSLVNLPTLTISSVGGIASPTTPSGSYSTPDVPLPPGTTNPVTITLTATNTPLATQFTVKLRPQFGAAATATSTPSSGTFETATATANVSFPLGQVSVLNVFASFTLPQVAALFPLIDGEPVEQILVAANYGEPSTLSLVTKSGKTVTMDRLSPDEQRRVALVWEVLHTSH